MIFIGSFSFDRFTDIGSDEQGSFELVVKERDLPDAIDSLTAHLHRLVKSDPEVFGGRIRFYLDGIIDIDPKQLAPTMINFRSGPAALGRRLVHSLMIPRRAPDGTGFCVWKGPSPFLERGMTEADAARLPRRETLSAEFTRAEE